MKNALDILLVLIFLTGCAANDSEIKSDAETSETSSEIAFESLIRPHKQQWDITENYYDTLTFDSWDDHYDYWYAFFKTEEGETVSMLADQAIDDKFSGSTFLVEWKIDSVYEAGEGDEHYYQERLLSYAILEKEIDFAGYLQDFIKVYSRDSHDLLKEYVHEEFIGSIHPGIYCMTSGELSHPKQFISWDCVIQDGFPEGDFCEGYNGVEDGLYFESISENELPFFANIDDEMNPVAEQVQMPEKLQGNELKKVLIVLDEYHYRYLYFIEDRRMWYLWIEDICDCSA